LVRDCSACLCWNFNRGSEFQLREGNHTTGEGEQLQVGPHSAGRLSVELDWKELKPFFAPGFDPAELPQPF